MLFGRLTRMATLCTMCVNSTMLLPGILKRKGPNPGKNPTAPFNVALIDSGWVCSPDVSSYARMTRHGGSWRETIEAEPDTAFDERGHQKGRGVKYVYE